MAEQCVFCAIVAGTSPATFVRRWDDAVAIVPLGPVTGGHVLVIPTVHVVDALQDLAVTGVTFARAAEIAPHPCNLITNAGRVATQSVFHLHVHVVPRAEDDGLALPWYSGRRSGGGRRG
ncbi:HIT domain-containing protein [Micromonospora tulbaghiae]|uniref:HIT family protein n=1 Tax=Micromonospora tulbaghiae TaxID=479978 RepID=UPI0033BFBCF3